MKAGDALSHSTRTYSLTLSSVAHHSLKKATASAHFFLLSVKTFLLSIEKSLSPGPVTKIFEGTAQTSQKKKKMPTQTNTSTRHIIDILIHGLHPNFKGTFN